MLKLLPSRSQSPCIRQASEEDCGAACLATICKFYGRLISLTRCREVVGTGQLGTTLLGLKRGAEHLGFNARSIKANHQLIKQLHKVPLPAIIHWQGHHWVVLYGRLGKTYVIADPAVGQRRLSQQELMTGWNGIMLLLEPDPERFAQETPDESTHGFGRFLQRILPYKALLAEALVINIVLGLLSLTSPFLLQILTDDVLVRGDTQLLTVVVIGVILLGLFNSCLQFIQSIMIAHFGQRLHLGLVLEFGRKILHLPLPYYESRRSGEIVSRLQDINEINQLVAQIVARLPSQFFVALISFGLMLFYSWKLTGLSLLIALLMTLIALPVLPILRQRNRNLLILGAENQGVLVETFKGALEVKATTAAGQFWEEFQTRFGRLANLSLSMLKLSIAITTLTQFVANIGGVMLLAFGSLLVINKELSIGQLLAFNAMQTNVFALISALVNLLDEYFRSQTAVGRLLEVIDAAPETQKESTKPVAKISGNAKIHCNNLYFHHAGRVDLLENFSLTLPGGKVIALIGKSGCGKSTLAKLIAGLYQPQSGNIRVGMYNLADLPIDCLRQQLVYVPQDAHFWSRSILENFRLGNPNLSFEQIVTACQIAEIDDFISHLPNNYQTILGEFGANLSGGQRQRLAIARAIATNPPILIMDESTAGLDPISECQVLDKLLKQRRGKTTIMITHRPTVINRCDWVVLISEGQIQLQGELLTLLNQPGDHLKFLRN